jgi:hypothetical protein
MHDSSSSFVFVVAGGAKRHGTTSGVISTFRRHAAGRQRALDADHGEPRLVAEKIAMAAAMVRRDGKTHLAKKGSQQAACGRPEGGVPLSTFRHLLPGAQCETCRKLASLRAK